MTRRRTALVTAGAHGTGLAIARRLAAAGFDLTVSAHTKSAAMCAADELMAYDTRVVAAKADLSSEEDVRELALGHLCDFGPLDTLVLNADLASFGPLESIPTRRWDLVFDVNVRSQLILIQSCLPALRAAAALSTDYGAKVIAIASMAGIASEPDLAAYSASKAALISLCQSVTLAERTHGVTATTISPDYVNTGAQPLAGSAGIQADDIATLVLTLSQLSRRAVVSNLAISSPDRGQHHDRIAVAQLAAV